LVHVTHVYEREGERKRERETERYREVFYTGQ